MNLCDKLPSVIYPTSSIDSAYLNRLRAIYNRDLVDNDVYFRNKIVQVREKDDPRGVYNSFDHVSCETIKVNGEKIKRFEKERCARITWLKPILEMAECTSCGDYIFKTWEEPARNDKKKKDFIIWCTYTNYIIILAIEKNSYVIRSAYCVLYENKVRELNSRYDKYH